MIHLGSLFLADTTPAAIPRDNVIRLQLLEDGEPLHLRYDPPPTLDRFVVVVGSVTLDSATAPTAFSYNAATSVLELRLALALTATLARTPLTLVVYGPAWLHGVVWLHPTATPDRLDLQVVEA